MNRSILIGALAGAAFATVAVLSITPAQGDGGGKEPSLAFHMGLWQRYSQKLGYAVQAKNKKLAAFYAHELHEAVEAATKAYPTYDGVKVAQLTEMMLEPGLKRVGKAIESGDWAKANKKYQVLIQSCNGCHSASKHDFIEIKPASGPPPFNQAF